MRNHQAPAASDRIHKQGVRPVKAIHITPVRKIGPAVGLHRSGNLQGHYVKLAFKFVFRNSAFIHQAQQVSVGGNIVKAVVVHADMADVGRHLLHRLLSAQFKKSLITRGIKLKNSRSDLKTLRPVGPTLGNIFTLPGEYRCALSRGVFFFNQSDLLTGKIPKGLQVTRQTA